MTELKNFTVSSLKLRNNTENLLLSIEQQR